MIEDLISKVFASRNAAHLAHWNTRSFAEHMALGDFYDGVIDLLDKLVEAYQGYYGLVGDVPTGSSKPDIKAQLTLDAAWINQNRTKIAKGVASLENIVDEISDLYLTTLYKLKFLD